MAIGDSISQPIPPVSTAGTTYASQLVAFLQEVKARLESQVPLSSLLAGTFDLDNNPIINTQYLELYEQEAAPSPVGAVYNYQGNLWYMSAAGAAQITSGNSLNAASLGGIDGDYGGGNPASLRFTDADETFYFYDNFGTSTWAHVDARSFGIHGGATEADRVRVTWAGSTSYTLTLPASAPAANGTLLQMDTSGTVSASSTGLDSVTLAANEHFTVSGTGKFKHGDMTLLSPVQWPMYIVGTTGTAGTPAAGTLGLSISASSSIGIPLLMPDVGKRVKSLTVRLHAGPGVAASFWAAYGVVQLDHTSWVTVSPETNTTSSSFTLTLDSGGLVMSSSIYLMLWVQTAGAPVQVSMVEVNYDAP